MTDERPQSDRDTITLTRGEVKDLIREGVHETLISLGIEPSHVGEMQRDFIFLRELRKTHERVKNKGLLVLAATVVGGVITLGVLGLKSWITGL